MHKSRVIVGLSMACLLLLTGCVAATPEPSATPLPTSTFTPVPPTNTATATDTDTPVPPTDTATSTNTPLPPTATNTATATQTPLPLPTRTKAPATVVVAPVTVAPAPTSVPTAAAQNSSAGLFVAGVTVVSNAPRTMVVDVQLQNLFVGRYYDITAYTENGGDCVGNCPNFKAQSGSYLLIQATSPTMVQRLNIEIDNILCQIPFTTHQLTIRFSLFIEGVNLETATFPATNDWCGA